MNIIQRRTWIMIMLLGLMLRLVGIGLNPVGLAHDEIHDIINAKSIALTGNGSPGTVAGILPSSGYCNGNCIFGELGTIIMSVWLKVFPMTILWVKVPFVAASLLIMWWTGKLVENLTKSSAMGKMTTLMVAISPWAILFGRTAYENLFAFAFFVGSLYFWSKNKATNKDAFIATALGFLASLSYFGAKVLWPPLMMVGIIYWSINSSKKKLGLVWATINLILVVIYAGMLLNSMAGVRAKELNLSNSKLTEIVNEERRMMLEMPFGLDKVVSNKAVTTIRSIGTKYLEPFSLRYYLTDSESAYDNFSIPGHGHVYLAEIILAIIGFGYMFGYSKKPFLFILSLLLIAPIPGAINTNASTYALRAGLMFPLISGLAGIGMVELNRLVNKKYLVYGMVLPLLVVSLVYFELLYWYRLPFEKSSGYVFHERVMINYINLLSRETKDKVVISVNDPVDVMYNYGFYTGKANDKEWTEKMNATILDNSYEIDNFKLTRNCPDKISLGTIYIWERERGCVAEPNRLERISEPRDGGARFFIPEEKLCKEYNLNSYPYPRVIRDFDIEKMSKSDFCNTWISRTSKT